MEASIHGKAKRDERESVKRERVNYAMRNQTE